MSQRLSTARRERILGQARRCDRNDVAIAAVLGVLTIVIGAVRATRHSLWIDEAATAVFMQRSPRGLLSLLWHEGGMGPYYIAMWFWVHISASDWWLRMFSVVGGACTLIAVYWLARMLRNRLWSVVAVALVMIHPQFMANLSNARDYTWVMFGSALSFITFFRYIDRGRTRNLLAYAVVNGVSLAMTVWMAPLVAVQAFWLLWTRRNRDAIRALVIASSVSLVLAAPFLHALVTTRSLRWIPELTWAQFSTESALLFGGAWWMWFLAIGNGSLIALVVARRAGVRFGSRMVLLSIGAIVTPLTVALASTVKPSYIARYMVQSLSPAILGAVAGFGGLISLVASAEHLRRRVGVVALSLALALGVVLFPYRKFGAYGTVQDLRGAARVLEAEQQPGDRYLFVAPWLWWLVGHYWQAPTDAVVTSLDGLAPGTRVWLVVLNPEPGVLPVKGGHVLSKYPLANIEVSELVVD